jgi:pyruvate/2-oxoglutarate dehydrogenase complex dihydrolipoamide acyltransferase (E2) component
MKIVTYRGPEDPTDPTNQYAIRSDDGGVNYFPLNLPVEVSDHLATVVGEQEGHDFDVAAGSVREISPAARKLATESNFDLDSIEGDGPIGVDDVREAIKAADAAQNQES